MQICIVFYYLPYSCDSTYFKSVNSGFVGQDMYFLDFGHLCLFVKRMSYSVNLSCSFINLSAIDVRVFVGGEIEE